MPSFDDAIYQNRLAEDVGNIAPLATTYHQAAPVPLAAPVTPFTPPPSNVGKAVNFFKDVGSSIGHIGEAATKWLGNNAVQIAEAPIKFGASSAHLILDNSAINDVNKNSDLTSARIDSLIGQYKSGQISKEDYQKGLAGYADDMDNWESQTNQLTKKVTKDAGEFLNSSITTAADVVTIITGGVGGVPLRSIGTQTAARFLSSDAADATVFRGAARLADLATNDAAFSALPTTMQATMQRAVAEVVANTTVHLSSPQIARAAMVNIALKAPISFNYLSSTATDLYHQLDDEKYGAAVRNIAINSLLLLGGGPVGEALSVLKKGSHIAENKIFGEGSFIDEISKNTGDGSADGIIKYINSLPEEVRAQYVKNLSATATRNTLAAKGSPVQGAWRLLNNMQASYQELDWRKLSHAEIVEDMMKEAEAARIASETGGKAVVVGRLDRRDLQTISAALTKDAGSTTTRVAEDGVNPTHIANYAKKYNMSEADAKAAILKARNTPVATTTAPAATGVGQAGSTLAPADKAGEAAAYDAKYGPTPPENLLGETTPPPSEPLSREVILSRWEALKKQFPNAAWANNGNFDRQVKALSNRYTTPGEFDKAMRRISTQETIEGFPKAVAAKLAKLGYIPIIPKNLENPFVEGDGKLVTKFGNNDLFTKAVKPMPVAGQLGSTLTHLGLSPQAATGRVYQMFQNELVGKLRDAGILEKATLDATHEQQSDVIYKQLSSYAAAPTRGGIKGIRPAITDMRQLTVKDIMAATGKGRYDAKRISGALKDAWLSVPLQTRGLGDRVVDLSYKLVPTTGAYTRIMGATRFSWNPFFQAKTLTKTESLVQLKTHGTWPSTLGMNKVLGVIFPDKYGEIENVRHLLHEANIFSNVRGPVVAGEAAEFGGTSSAKLTHKLLTGQERAISALVSVQADKAGMNTAQFIRQYPDTVRDTVQAIASYDKSSGLLSSPLARTLNFAFFPYRFEAKVAQVMVKSLAGTSPVTQMAVIRGLYNGSQFLKSPEGQAWYSQNSELIGLFKYFTPVTTIATIAEAFGQKPDSVGHFGELGGLPFGFIPMLLDAEGITHGLTQSPYVNPKTGKTMPDYIPATVKGHAIAGLQDFVSSLFTYPGTQAGLPSKTAFFHDLTNSMLAGSKSDFNKVTPELTNSEQKDFASVVQQLSNNAPTAPPEAPGVSPTTVVPGTKSPLENLVKVGNGKTTTKKKKKSEYTPQLLPGQSALGVL